MTGGKGEPHRLGEGQHFSFRHRDESLKGIVELGMVIGEDVSGLREAGGASIQKFPFCNDKKPLHSRQLQTPAQPSSGRREQQILQQKRLRIAAWFPGNEDNSAVTVIHWTRPPCMSNI